VVGLELHGCRTLGLRKFPPGSILSPENGGGSMQGQATWSGVVEVSTDSTTVEPDRSIQLQAAASTPVFTPKAFSQIESEGEGWS
jgi:hypothetical protein